MAIACENGCRKIVLLMLRLWSSEHPDCTSDNDEIEQVVGQIASTTGGRGIFVYRTRLSKGSVAFSKGGDIPAFTTLSIDNKN